MFLRNRATPVCYDHIKDSPKDVNVTCMKDFPLFQKNNYYNSRMQITKDTMFVC